MASLLELNDQIFNLEIKMLDLVQFFYDLCFENRKKYFDHVFFTSLEFEILRQNSLFQQIYSESQLYSEIGMACDAKIEKWRLLNQLPDDRPQIEI